MELCDLLDLSALAVTAQYGWLYQAADTATATGVSGAQFALFNSGSRGLPLRVVSVRVSAAAAMQAVLGWSIGDPGLTAGNTPANLRIGGSNASAANQAQVTAAPTLERILAIAELQVGGVFELLLPGSIYLPYGRALVVSSAAVDGVVDVTWLWAEIENL
jgi:hypothetical protein